MFCINFSFLGKLTGGRTLACSAVAPRPGAWDWQRLGPSSGERARPAPRPAGPQPPATCSLGRAQGAGGAGPGTALAPSGHIQRRFPAVPTPRLPPEVSAPGGEGTCLARQPLRHSPVCWEQHSLTPGGSQGKCERKGNKPSWVPAQRLPRNRRGAGAPRGARSARRPPRALTGEAAAPVAVPAAPLQDEVAAAPLGHPQPQRALQRHLLRLEPHRSAPAAGPLTPPRGRRPSCGGGCGTPAGPPRASGSAAGAGRPAQARPAPPRVAPGPAPRPPTAAPPAPAPGAESGRLPRTAPGRREDRHPTARRAPPAATRPSPPLPPRPPRPS